MSSLQQKTETWEGPGELRARVIEHLTTGPTDLPAVVVEDAEGQRHRVTGWGLLRNPVAALAIGAEVAFRTSRGGTRYVVVLGGRS